MKLIIDIPEELHRGIERRNPELETEYVCDKLMKAVDNGTPLDDVKAELESGGFTDLEGDTYIYVPYAFEILDNIGKAESEDNK